jgi:hypothetical protein
LAKAPGHRKPDKRKMMELLDNGDPDDQPVRIKF